MSESQNVLYRLMNIVSERNIDRAKWSTLVAASATGTWFQTPEAFDFFASMPELYSPFAIAICNHKFETINAQSTLRAVCVGYVTVETNAVKQYMMRRAIIVGGPALADDVTDAEVTELMSAVRKQLQSQAIYVETRNFNDYSRWKEAFAKAGFGYQPHLNFHVDCTDKAAMDGRLSENRKRQIKRAVKSGVEIRSEGISESEIREWYEILLHLYKTRIKTPLFPLSFFTEFYRQGLGRYLLVKFEGKVIGGIMCPILEGRCIYEWFVCGMDTEYRNQNPSVMATYAAMEYGNTHGLMRFDFMGAGEPGVPYGVRDFKAEFGGELVEHGRFLCVSKPIQYKIGVMGVKILKKIK